MHQVSRRLAGLAGALLVLGAVAATAFPPERPFNPQLLMPAVQARAQGGRFRFVVLGDSKNNPPFADVLKLTASMKPDFVLSTGDLVDKGSGLLGAREYDRLAERAGSFMRRVPTWPVLGNHEVSGGDASEARANYARFFGIQQDNYSFDVGSARFIALAWPEPDAAGRAWLEKQLAAARGRLIFIFQHNPYYTVGSETQVKNRASPITRLFRQYGVTTVFQGHDHGYYRTRRDGVWCITSAGAGAKIYRLNRFREALPEDVFYGWAPMDGSPVGPDRYWLRRPDGGGRVPTPVGDWPRSGQRRGPGPGRDRTFERPRYYVIAVDVDSAKVTARAVTTGGEELDSVTLSSGQASLSRIGQRSHASNHH